MGRLPYVPTANVLCRGGIIAYWPAYEATIAMGRDGWGKNNVYFNHCEWGCGTPIACSSNAAAPMTLK